MRSIFFFFAAAIFLSAVNPATAQRTPLFRDFPTGAIYGGPHSKPDLSSRDAYNYRTRLRDAAQEDVNFASHYRVVTWGCGTSCVSGAVVDVMSGRVTLFPFSICCSVKIGEADFQPVLVRPNSRLIVFVGQRGEEPPDAAHFYEFTGREFVFLASSKPFSQPLSDSVAQEKPSPAPEAIPGYHPSVAPPPPPAPIQSRFTATPAPPAVPAAPPANLGPGDLPVMHQTYEMNQARFARDYVGKSFFGILTLAEVRENLIFKGKYEIGFGQRHDGVSCSIDDKPTIDLMTDKNKGDQISVFGIVKDHEFGSVILDSCKLASPR